MDRRRFLSLLAKMSLFGYAAITANGKILGTTTTIHSYNPADCDVFFLIEPLRFFGKQIITLTKDDINSLRMFPVTFGNNPHVQSVSLSNGDDFVLATTCADYENALETGYSARTTFDITMESWLKHYCTLLHFLSFARRPLENNISGSSFDCVSEWPATMLPKPSDRVDTQSGKTICQLVDFNDLNISRSYNRLTIARDEMNYLYVEAAKADFSGHKSDEFFIYRYISSSSGTFRFSDCVILSRDLESSGFIARGASLNSKSPEKT